jgi:hypothetical protein
MGIKQQGKHILVNKSRPCTAIKQQHHHMAIIKPDQIVSMA